MCRHVRPKGCLVVGPAGWVLFLVNREAVNLSLEVAFLVGLRVAGLCFLVRRRVAGLRFVVRRRVAGLCLLLMVVCSGLSGSGVGKLLG